MAAAVVWDGAADAPQREKFSKWRNLTPKQKAAIDAMYLHPNARVLMGGSGFGGKSYGLRAGAVHFCLKMRRLGIRGKVVLGCYDYQQLRDRHFEYFTKEYGEIGEFKEAHKVYGKCFLFHDRAIPPICFRNFEAVAQRKGSEYLAAFVDELTELLRPMYADIEYMVRDSDAGRPYSPVLAGSNPDGIGHPWVKAVWRPHVKDKRLVVLECDGKEYAYIVPARHPVAVDPDGDLDSTAYFYVPFLPSDNPAYNEARFNASIAHLAPHIRRARKTGSWDTPEGAFFPYLSEETHRFNLRETFPYGVPAGWPRELTVDYGRRAPFAALWLAYDIDGNAWVYRELYEAGWSATQQIQAILNETGEDEVISSFTGDPRMWDKLPKHEHEEDYVPSEQYDKAIAGDYRFRCGFEKGADGLRRHKFETLHAWLDRDNDFPNLYISDECENLWGELNGAVYPKGTSKKETLEEPDEKCPDHALSALYFRLHRTTPRARAAGEQRVRRVVGRVTGDDVEKRLKDGIRRLRLGSVRR